MNGMIFDKYSLMVDRLYRKTINNNIQPYIPLYHGSPEMRFKPVFGLGQDKHDYGPGFYTTLDINLARE